MSFVKRVIGPDERLIGISSAHWIYGARGILWLASLSLFGIVLERYSSAFLVQFLNASVADTVGNTLFWIPTALGFVMFISFLGFMVSPEIALTTKRIIYKKGIFFVEVQEVDLEEIKAADVDNGLLGRFLNYGYVVFDSRFVRNISLPAIGKPYRFIKAMNEARSQLKEDSMTVVLEGVGEAVQQEIANAAQQQLSSPRYSDSMSDPGEVIGQLARETAENTRRALRPEGEEQAKPPENAAGPTIFHPEILSKKKRLRKLVKDNFTRLRGSPAQRGIFQ